MEVFKTEPDAGPFHLGRYRNMKFGPLRDRVVVRRIEGGKDE